ncbi:Fc receptor-like protein 5 [Poecilia latipinna]|uniref:Fc receptor-like protein 5 n=1 Tax=Poecilia latipinna TaxID=48699 RepID=UPI00072DD145|nr:PREDICTED: Fc receptor-like protein 5 [Poecilia latipinna]
MVSVEGMGDMKEVLRASLTVDPSSSQIFEGEPLRLSCDDDISSSAGWILRRNTSNQHMTECGVKWGRRTGATCRISLTVSWDSGLYWCQSTEGVISSMVNLTVTGGSVILQSPVLPVMEGDDVTLSCRAKSPAHNLPAAFYKDGSFIGDGPSGHMTLLHVSSSDEGLYKCSISGQGESPSSRISVEVSASAPPPVEEGLHFVFHVLLHLLVFCPYFICTALLVSVCRSRTTEPGLDDEYDDVATPVATEHHF